MARNNTAFQEDHNYNTRNRNLILLEHDIPSKNWFRLLTDSNSFDLPGNICADDSFRTIPFLEQVILKQGKRQNKRIGKTRYKELKITKYSDSNEIQE